MAPTSTAGCVKGLLGILLCPSPSEAQATGRTKTRRPVISSTAPLPSSPISKATPTPAPSRASPSISDSSVSAAVTSSIACIVDGTPVFDPALCSTPKDSTSSTTTAIAKPQSSISDPGITASTTRPIAVNSLKAVVSSTTAASAATKSSPSVQASGVLPSSTVGAIAGTLVVIFLLVATIYLTRRRRFRRRDRDVAVEEEKREFATLPSFPNSLASESRVDLHEIREEDAGPVPQRPEPSILPPSYSPEIFSSNNTIPPNAGDDFESSVGEGVTVASSRRSIYKPPII